PKEAEPHPQGREGGIVGIGEAVLPLQSKEALVWIPAGVGIEFRYKTIFGRLHPYGFIGGPQFYLGPQKAPPDQCRCKLQIPDPNPVVVLSQGMRIILIDRFVSKAKE